MDYSALVLEVDEIIAEFGQPITIKTTTIGEYDPITGVVNNTTTNVIAKGVLFDYGEKDINGTTILKGDKKLYITANGVSSITTNDSISIGTTDYHITSVTQTNPAGTNLLWEVSVRGVS